MVKEIVHNVNPVRPGFFMNSRYQKNLFYSFIPGSGSFCRVDPKETVSDIRGGNVGNIVMLFLWHRQIISIDKIILIVILVIRGRIFSE